MPPISAWGGLDAGNSVSLLILQSVKTFINNLMATLIAHIQMKNQRKHDLFEPFSFNDLFLNRSLHQTELPWMYLCPCTVSLLCHESVILKFPTKASPVLCTSLKEKRQVIASNIKSWPMHFGHNEYIPANMK